MIYYHFRFIYIWKTGLKWRLMYLRVKCQEYDRKKLHHTRRHNRFILGKNGKNSPAKINLLNMEGKWRYE